MSDPYRAPGDDDGRRVIARRGRGALAWHAALALAGLSTPLLTVAFLDEVPALFVLMILGVPLGILGAGRTVHACFVPHLVELDDKGLHFAWGTRVIAMPWLDRHDRELPWSSLRGIHTHTVSINGLATTTLVVATDDGSFEVPDDRFDRPAFLIQRDILDFAERMREPPPAAPTAQRMRERFAVPQRRVQSPWSVIGACAFFLPFIAFPVWLATETPGWVTYAFAGFAIVVFGGLSLLGWRNWWRTRVLYLGPDGMRIGPHEGRARLIRWDDIRLVRRETTNGKLDALDVVEHDGTHTSIRNDYGLGLAALARMVDPQA